MSKIGKRRDTGCPIAFALDTFGDRWSLLVIRDLLFRQKRTYGEFLDCDEKFATNILADRLKFLEAEGIIAKARDPQNQRSHIYSLTQKGIALAPVLVEFMRWSGKYDANTFVSQHVLDRLDNDREGFLSNVRARLEED
ncbi:MAG: winged helix-turn-helix transcriptional regulator [Alphaproteobacteria bacterium]